jgi:GH35 family endo-1,4-beta-xylanase
MVSTVKALNGKGTKIYLATAVIIAVMLILTPAGKAYAAPAQGQLRLYGKVTGIQGMPITDGTVYISNKDFSPVCQADTDDRGYYEALVPNSDEYNLYIGVKSQNDKYAFAYIPQNRTITTQHINNAEIDFNLKPGATIAIDAFDEQGKLLRNQDFRRVTEGKVFATDLNNLPAYSSFDAIHDEYSGWQWDQAIPAFVVLPESTYKFFCQWEVPDFGKVMLSADNQGRGYTLDNQGDKLTINFNYEAAQSKVAELQNSYQQFESQGYDIPDSVTGNIEQAKAHIKQAESYLGKNPADMSKAVEELDVSLKLSLYADEELQVARAKADIEKYRKGTTIIRVLDDTGNPVENAQITFTQISNDFLFGANPMGENGSYDPQYAQLMKNAGINNSDISFRWGEIEPDPGVFNWDNVDKYQNIQSQLNDGFKTTGSLSLWLHRDDDVRYDFCPGYLSNLDFNELNKNVYEYIYALATRYKGKIDIWEINEMNLAWANALNLTSEQKLELTKTFTEAVKAANPEAKVLQNSLALPFEFGPVYSDFDTTPYPVMLSSLEEKGIPVDIIGLEFYYSGVSTTGYAQPVLDLASVSNLLDRYNSYGKPVYVNELSAPSTYIQGSGWWHSPWNEETQAEYVEKFYTIAFSKPMVKLINWSWGSADEDAFTIGGGLIDSNLEPKISYQVLQKLIDSWHTSGTGITDNKGELGLKGFAGDYAVSVETASGQDLKTQIHISEQQSTQTEINIAGR